MPTAKPRLTVVLPPDVASVLRELAELSGKSQSALVAELLESAAPVFSRVIRTIKAANSLRDSVRRDFVGSLERAQARIEAEVPSLLAALDDGLGPVLEAVEGLGGTPEGGPAGGASAAPAGHPEGVPGVATPVALTGGSGRPKVVRKAKRQGLTRTERVG